MIRIGVLTFPTSMAASSDIPSDEASVNIVGADRKTETEWALERAVEALARADFAIALISRSRQTIPVKAGFIAEELHALSFTLDSLVKGCFSEAFTDRHEDFSSFGYGANSPSDIIALNPRWTIFAQVKYYGAPDKTATALREIRYGVHIYQGMQLIAPPEQILGVQYAARKTMMRERAPARRMVVAAAAEAVLIGTSDRIELDGIQSLPLTLDQAREIAHEPYGAARSSYVERFAMQLVGEALHARLCDGMSLTDLSTLFPYNPQEEAMYGDAPAMLEAKRRARRYLTSCAEYLRPQIENLFNEPLNLTDVFN